MKEIKLYLSVYLDVQAYDFFSKWWVAVSSAVMFMELMPFQLKYACQHVKLSAIKLRENEKKIKTLDSEIFTLYTFCFLKWNFHCCTVWSTDAMRSISNAEIEEMWLVTSAFCKGTMRLQRLVTSDGGQYYAHDRSSFCQPNMGWKKEDLV